MPGRLLFEYRPPRAHPILYAGLLVFGLVWITGSIEAWASGAARVIYFAYALPWLATLAILLALYPSDTRIYADGIAPSRALAVRWHRPFIAWADLAAVYPSYYDVTGAFVSPFASSDGKVTQMGLALESPDGRIETVKFTPSRFQMWQPESAGYTNAMEAVRHAFAERPLVAAAETFTKDEAAAMIAEANKPFLPFFAIVLLFASAAPVLWLLFAIGASVALALPLALVAPLAVSMRSYVQSRRRHTILNRLSKAAYKGVT